MKKTAGIIDHKTHIFPKSRIATNDVCAMGPRKHHIVALIEVDVTESREKLKLYKKNHNNISFTTWLIKGNKRDNQGLRRCSFIS